MNSFELTKLFSWIKVSEWSVECEVIVDKGKLILVEYVVFDPKVPKVYLVPEGDSFKVTRYDIESREKEGTWGIVGQGDKVQCYPLSSNMIVAITVIDSNKHILNFLDISDKNITVADTRILDLSELCLDMSHVYTGTFVDRGIIVSLSYQFLADKVVIRTQRLDRTIEHWEFEVLEDSRISLSCYPEGYKLTIGEKTFLLNSP